MNNEIFNKIHIGYRGSVFWKPKVKEKCSGKVIKGIDRKLHEAEERDAENDYSRGHDHTITLVLNILLEETGYDMKDVIG